MAAEAYVALAPVPRGVALGRFAAPALAPATAFAAVVATEAVGAAAGGLVVDGETGLVVPEGNPAALARALDRLVGDEAYRRAISSSGSEHVQAWNFEAAADVFEAAITGAEAPPWAVAA